MATTLNLQVVHPLWTQNTRPDPAEDGFFRTLLDGLHDGVYFVDTDRRITYWNRGAERITGYSAEEMNGRYCWDNLLGHVDERGCEMCTHTCPLTQAMNDRQAHESEAYLRHRTGKRVAVNVRAAPITGPRGQIIGAIETFSDNSSKVKAMETAARLSKIAYLDPLTETGNRRYCAIRLREELNRATDSEWTFGGLFLDIDHFKEVNDRFGHQAGDAVLKTVAGTLESNLRAGDFLGRWGGEEFLIILSNAPPQEVRQAAERLRMLVEKSRTKFGGHSIQTTVSIGATCFRREDTFDTVVARADELLYRSKDAGRNRVTCLF